MDSFMCTKSYILFLPGVFIDDCKDSDDEPMESVPKVQDPEMLEDTNTEEDSDSEEDINLKEVTNEDFNGDWSEDFNKSKNYEAPPKYYIDPALWIKSTNLLCAFCHCKINGIPWPVPINQVKILIHEHTYLSERIISLVSNKKISDTDENILFSSPSMKEVKAFQIHNILCCKIGCVGNYIKKVDDLRIINKKESIKMALMIYKSLTGKEIEEIPDQNLWIVMRQYCGASGQTEEEYHEEHNGKELRLKAACNA